MFSIAHWSWLCALLLIALSFAGAARATDDVPNDVSRTTEDGQRLEDQKKLYEDVLSARRALSEAESRGKNSYEVGRAMVVLSQLYLQQNRYTDAAQFSRRALQILEGAGVKEIDLVDARLIFAHALGNESSEAETQYKRALQALERHPLDLPRTDRALSGLAFVYEGQARYAEAEQIWERIIEVIEANDPKNISNKAFAMRKLAEVQAEQGRAADARISFERVLKLYEESSNSDPRQKGRAIVRIAKLLRESGQVEEAELRAREALSILEAVSTAPGTDRDLSNALSELASNLEFRKRYVEAESLYRRALKIRQAIIPRYEGPIAVTAGNVARVLEAQGRASEAREFRSIVDSFVETDVARIGVVFATNRSQIGRNFGEEQVLDPARMVLGRAVVKAPKAVVLNRANRMVETFGQLENATSGRLTDESLLVLDAIESDDGEATERLAQTKADLSRAVRFPKQAIIYVHGYNNTFEEALRRAAMISFDLEFDGMTAAFAWPSRKGFAAYLGDRDRAAAAAPFLLRMLETLGADLPDTRIHLLAHSTGAEVVLHALERLADRGEKLNLGEVVFAHADVSASRMATAMLSVQKLNVLITSYTSAEDLAMRASGWLRGDGSRVGGAPVYLPGVESIDISQLGATLSINHNTFVRNPLVFSDIARLLSTGQHPPNHRTGYFVEVINDKGKYWQFEAPK